MTDVQLSDEIVRLVQAQITAGRARSLEDVIRAGVAALEQYEADDDAKLIRLREIIDAGDASPDAPKDAFDHIRAKYGLSSSR